MKLSYGLVYLLFFGFGIYVVVMSFFYAHDHLAYPMPIKNSLIVSAIDSPIMLRAHLLRRPIKSFSLGIYTAEDSSGNISVELFSDSLVDPILFEMDTEDISGSPLVEFSIPDAIDLSTDEIVMSISTNNAKGKVGVYVDSQDEQFDWGVFGVSVYDENSDLLFPPLLSISYEGVPVFGLADLNFAEQVRFIILNIFILTGRYALLVAFLFCCMMICILLFMRRIVKPQEFESEIDSDLL